MRIKPPVQMQFGLSGHFQLIVHGGKRGRKVLAEFDNLILDHGLNRFTTTASLINAAHVGTSNAAVVASQTALSSFLAGTSTTGTGHGVNTYVAGPPAYHQGVFVFRFATGTATGNLSEVGVGSQATSGNLFSRALIVDGGGTPTSITVLSDESLDVVYTLRVYAPADVTGSVTIGGTSYSYTIRPAYFSSATTWGPTQLAAFALNASNSTATSYTGTLGAITGIPGGTSSSTQGTAIAQAYSNNSFYRDIVVTQGITAGNVSGGTQSLVIWAGNNSTGELAFQIQFSPNIPKDNTKTFTLNFRIAWARRP